MPKQSGLSGPRRRYEKAPSEENLGDVVDVTNENQNKITKTDVEFGEGVDFDFSLVKDRETVEKRSKYQSVSIAVVSVFVLFLMVVVKPNYSFSKTPTLHPPNHNLEQMCSNESVTTSDGLSSCKTVCEPASCCFTSSPSNCFIENRKVCHEYSSCKPFFSEEEYSKEEPYFFETGKVDKNGNIGYIEGETDSESKKKDKKVSPGLTGVKPAPLNIDDLCSKENRITASGMLQCEAACEGGSCCWEGTCGERYQKECKNYQVCNSAGTSLVSPTDQVNYLCSPTRIGNISKSLSALERDKNMDECRSICEPRSCCFSNSLNNCYGDNSQWCDEFASCKGLSNTDADSPPPIPTGTVDIKNDCREELVLSSNDYVKCEQACLIASCCFSEEGCAKKGVKCEDFSVCESFIESVETGGGSFAGTTGKFTIETDDSLTANSGGSFPYINDKLDKSKLKPEIEQGNIENGKNEEIDDYFTKYENVQDEKASSYNTESHDDVYKEENEVENSIGIQQTEQNENVPPLGTKESENNDDLYYKYKGTTEDIEKTVGQNVNIAPKNDDYFFIEENKESSISDGAQQREKTVPTQSKNDGNDDRYYHVEAITQDIENSVNIRANDDYFDIDSKVPEGNEQDPSTVKPNDDQLIQDLLKMEKEVEQFEESIDAEEILEERPNLTSLVPALDAVCDAENIDNPEVVRECEEACAPALCCVAQGDIDCSVSDPSLCRAFSACNPFWEMDGFHPKFIEEKKEVNTSEKVEFVEEVVTNKFGDPVETVDVPMISSANSNSKLTAISSVCSNDAIQSLNGYNECVILCNPALCCIGLGEDCSISKQGWCAEHDICRNVWTGPSAGSEETNEKPNEVIILQETPSPSVRTTDMPTTSPTYRTTPHPTYNTMDLSNSIPEIPNETSGEDESIGKVCSDENIASRGGLNQCVLKCNEALCCVGMGTDCFFQKREWCEEYTHTCNRIFSEELNINFGAGSQQNQNEMVTSITSAPTQNPTHNPTHNPTAAPTSFPKKTANVQINSICSKENVESQDGHDHCILECNVALCCFRVGSDCSRSRIEWCGEYQSCSNVFG